MAVPANGTDNIDEVKDIMQFFCCEKEPMKQISMDQVEFYNNKEAMEEIANSDYGSDFLSGQNPYKDFCKSAENISNSNFPHHFGVLNLEKSIL